MTGRLDSEQSHREDLESQFAEAHSQLEGALNATAEAEEALSQSQANHANEIDYLQSELGQVKDEYENAKNEHQNSIDAVSFELQEANQANADLQVRVI